MSPQRKSKIIPGDLVRHVSDESCNDFGLGVVTSVFTVSPSSPWVAKVAWQLSPKVVVYPSQLFTFDGLVVVSCHE